ALNRGGRQRNGRQQQRAGPCYEPERTSQHENELGSTIEQGNWSQNGETNSLTDSKCQVVQALRLGIALSRYQICQQRCFRWRIKLVNDPDSDSTGEYCTKAWFDSDHG